MSESEWLQRKQMIVLAQYVYVGLEEMMNSLVAELCQKVGRETGEEIRDSLERISNVANTIASDDRYVKEEDPKVFWNIIEDLKNVFKVVLLAFFSEEGLSTSSDNIGVLNRDFFDRLESKYEHDHREQVYPAITLLISYLRGREEHTSPHVKPVDPLTRKRSFGNLYTLCSIFILSVYGYVEVLQTWSNVVRSKARVPDAAQTKSGSEVSST